MRLSASFPTIAGCRWSPMKGAARFVTGHLDEAMLNDGDVDIYLCTPTADGQRGLRRASRSGDNPAGF